MLYLLYGADFKKTRSKLHSVVGGLQARRPDSGLFKITDEDFIDAEAGRAGLKELVSSQGLFGGSYIVICEHLLSVYSEVVELLPQMTESQHIFIFVEGHLSKTDLKPFEKCSAKIQHFDLKTKSPKPFNVFLLADALANKNKKDIWVLYQKALRSNVPPEQIHGILFWQIKTLLLVALSSREESLGLKTFVLQKSRRALTNWDTKELLELSQEMVSLYHQSRSTGQELKVSLEELLISL